MQEFKIGDLIIIKSTIKEIIKIEEFCDFKRFYFKEDDWFDSDDINGYKAWRPKVEEICIFWNDKAGIKVISRFYAFEHDGFTEAIEFRNYRFCIPYLYNN